MADLPVPVRERPTEGGVDVGALEGGESQYGPASHGGAIVRGGEDGGESAFVAQRAQGSDGSFPAERVVVQLADGYHRPAATVGTSSPCIQRGTR